MKKYLIIFFIVSGCSANENNSNINSTNMNFSNDLTFDEFKIRLKVYANDSPYPNIDN